MHRTLLPLAGLALLCAGCFASPVIVKDCSGYNSTISVDITPCEGNPCVFHEGGSAKVVVVFKAPFTSSALTVHIYGYVLGIKTPFPLQNPNGCNGTGLTCPIQQGQTYTYVAQLAMPPHTPSMKVVVEWDITGDSGEKAFCFDFPLEIDSNNRVRGNKSFGSDKSSLGSNKPFAGSKFGSIRPSDTNRS